MKDVLGGVHGLASFLAAFFHYNFNVIVCTHRTAPARLRPAPLRDPVLLSLPRVPNGGSRRINYDVLSYAPRETTDRSRFVRSGRPIWFCDSPTDREVRADVRPRLRERDVFREAKRKGSSSSRGGGGPVFTPIDPHHSAEQQ